SDAADGVNQPRTPLRIDFSSETRHLHVDHVVQRGSAAGLSPDFSRQHFARHEVPLVPQQVFEQLKFAHGEVQQTSAADRPTCHEMQLEVSGCEPENLDWSATTYQRADTRKQLR